MECPRLTSFATSRTSHTFLFKTSSSSHPNLDPFGRRRCCWSRITNRQLPLPTQIHAVPEAAAAAGVPHAEITWQILLGAVAGVTPFIIAGIEFSKRIVAQRRCGVCGGSGLVQRDKYYFRCPSCGGFLPWQSWKRFFSG